MNNVPNDFNNQNANGYNFDPNQQVEQMNFNPGTMLLMVIKLPNQ